LKDIGTSEPEHPCQFYQPWGTKHCRHPPWSCTSPIHSSLRTLPLTQYQPYLPFQPGFIHVFIHTYY